MQLKQKLMPQSHILSEHCVARPLAVTMIITHVLCNRYTKTQSYMQCGTMSVKNLIECLGVHDKTDHILVSQVTLIR